MGRGSAHLTVSAWRSEDNLHCVGPGDGTRAWCTLVKRSPLSSTKLAFFPRVLRTELKEAVYFLSTSEAKVRGSGVQGHTQLCQEFETIPHQPLKNRKPETPPKTFSMIPIFLPQQAQNSTFLTLEATSVVPSCFSRRILHSAILIKS